MECHTLDPVPTSMFTENFFEYNKSDTSSDVTARIFDKLALMCSIPPISDKVINQITRIFV